MVLIILTPTMTISDSMASFRPLTGIMVLIDFLEFAIQLFFQVFPSPYGDYGSYHPKEKGKNLL